jgi:uncharacterized membrane protein YeaQ/YmgE (transglycosylase-associated protein family)
VAPGPHNLHNVDSTKALLGFSELPTLQCHLRTNTCSDSGGRKMLALASLAFLQQDRVVFVEWRHGLLWWIVIGLIAGWLAGKIARGEGYGCITDIILGLIGSVLGGWIFTKLGILGGGTLYSLAAATVGAVILVSIVHLFVGSSRRP